MLIAFISDEYDTALPGTSVEFVPVGGGPVRLATSSASGAVHVDALTPGDYQVCLAKSGFGSKQVTVSLGGDGPVRFRLLSDRFGVKSLSARCGDGDSGHETDKTSASSPANTLVLARGLNPDDGGAHMVYFETPSGGAVFSAGSITYGSALLRNPPTSLLTVNVLRRFLT